jgi:(p)ppGpp synthase/HD superfamily hydrolase
MKNLERALLVAEVAHSTQKYDIYPYIYHIKQVVKIAEELGYDETILVGCALHDVMEDADLSYNDIKKAFGEDVAEIVFCVTDELGRNRKERKEKTYPKIRANWKAIAVKICDRIANATHSHHEGGKSGMFKLYQKEHIDFCRNLGADNPHEETKKAWERLERLLG